MHGMTALEHHRNLFLKHLSTVLCSALFMMPVMVKGQAQVYQLSGETDSIVDLLSRDDPAQQINKVIDNLKNKEWAAALEKTKTQLKKAQGNEEQEIALNLRLGRMSKWGYGNSDGYEYFSRALFLAEKLGDPWSIAVASYELGNIIRLGSVRDRPFEDYFNRAIPIFESLESPLGKSYMLYAKMLLEDDRAIRLKYAEEAVALLKANLDRSDTLMMESLARSLNVAGLYQQEERKIERLKEGLSFAKAIGNYLMTAYLLNNIGFQYRSKKAYHEAIPYHLEALDVSTINGINGLAANSLNNLSVCYKDLGRFKEALDFYHAFFYLQSDLNSDVYLQNLAEMEVTHEVDRVELQNELLQSEQKLENRQKWIFAVLSLILLLIAGFVYWSRRRVAKTNEKLKALDKVKTRFFANISHELRTPLTLINAPIESLIHNDKINDPEVRQTLETATRNGESLLSLVEEILDLAKLDGGKLKLVENPVRVNDFLELLLSDYQAGLANKSIQLEYVFGPDKELAILMDERRCTKVVNNLLSNALKFTPEGGSITVEVTDNKAGDQLTIKVSDTGSGIHPEDLPRIFDRYYQSEQPGTKAEGGTGIGLALAKELAYLHGGDLTAESKPGMGSTFTFSIPIKEVRAETVALLSSIDDQSLQEALKNTVTHYSERFKVDRPVLLITEDHPEMRDFIAKTLAPYFEIRKAENGKVALDVLKRERIDIVISDVMMPVMDGFELLEEIKKDEALHQVSLIMLTARADHEDKLYALTLGIDDYLTKPFNASEFLARIKNILDNRIKILRGPSANDQADIKAFIEQFDLVEREVEVLSLLSKRYSNPQIAEELSISRNTVKFHLKNIFLKLDITSRTEAVDIVKPYLG